VPEHRTAGHRHLSCTLRVSPSACYSAADAADEDDDDDNDDDAEAAAACVVLPRITPTLQLA